MHLMSKMDYRKEIALITPPFIHAFISSHVRSTMLSNETHCIKTSSLILTDGPADGFRFPLAPHFHTILKAIKTF